MPQLFSSQSLISYLLMYVFIPLLGDIFSQFISRLVSQCEQFSTFLIHSYHKYMTGLRVVMETADHMTIDEDYLTRDEFSLHKMIIAVTRVGKVLFTLDVLYC